MQIDKQDFLDEVEFLIGMGISKRGLAEATVISNLVSALLSDTLALYMAVSPDIIMDEALKMVCKATDDYRE